MVILPSWLLNTAKAVVSPSRLVQGITAIDLGLVFAGIVVTIVPLVMLAVSFLALMMICPSTEVVTYWTDHSPSKVLLSPRVL